MALLGAFECTRNNKTSVDFANVGVIRFEVVAETREIGVDRFWVDMGGLPGHVETERVRGGLWWDIVEFAESEVRVNSGSLRSRCSEIYRHAHENGPL